MELCLDKLRKDSVERDGKGGCPGPWETEALKKPASPSLSLPEG